MWWGILLIVLPTSVLSWNALGHRLVAEIAYDQMTPHARQVFNSYNHALDKVYKPQSWVNSAVWLDTLRYQDVSWFSFMHYIDLPFSEDNSPLPTPQESNAVWAIDKSTHTLTNRYATNFDKGIALRVLIHVVGDLHQPLHAATKISTTLPTGDRGGNLVILPHNPVAKNLHAYWDKGAGLLGQKKRYSPLQIKRQAIQIEQRWACSSLLLDTKPIQWAQESHEIAINSAYRLPIDNHYQHIAQQISEKRIALAGCRLGRLLNKIAQNTPDSIG